MRTLVIDNEKYKNKNSGELLHVIKNLLIHHYSETDFDINRIFIGISTFTQTNIHTDFDNLRDALDCSIASSNVPFITGSIFQKYRNIVSYDGIFSKCPYLTETPTLHIHPNMWGQNEYLPFNLFKKDCMNLEKLFIDYIKQM